MHLTKGYLALVQREVHTVAVDTSHRSKEHLTPVQRGTRSSAKGTSLWCRGELALVQREVHTVAVDTSHRSKEHLTPVQKEVDTGAVVT
ncbi:MAG TPA: hypothetical protein PK185_05130 [Cyclobacteriaceae bacterium]|nr:hypothetical protein [Cyclobacteriaceae bacterium]